ncbi:MAG: tetratricopeptide repeat protein [Rhodovulum sp.]|nr:tetratricopeptide repeat protein [Rhodovulum sp.]
MNGLFDLLIAVLQEARTWGPTQQIGAVLGFLTTFVIVPLAALWKWMRARESRLAKEAAIVERDLAVADKVRKELTLENERLARFEPETVLHKLQAERRDNNRRSLVRIADGYMEHHRDAFAEACRILADHHLSRYEDGADALSRARAAAMGALAAAPDDRETQSLLDEIEALQRIEAAPPTTEEGTRQHEERERLRKLLRETPEDVEALREVGRREFDAGRYRTAIVFWERAEEALLSEGHDSSGDPRQLEIRLDLGRANLWAGHMAAARDIIAPLPGLCARVTTPTDPLTLSARRRLAELLSHDGASSQAEKELRELVPLMERLKGKEHPDTLTARHALALAIRDQDRAKEAEDMLSGLVPTMERVFGKEHPETHSTLYALATTISYQGRAAEAEAMLSRLVPMAEKVKGKEHPDTLFTRHALATAIRDQGRAVEAEGLLRDLLPLVEKVMGKEHPDTLVARYALATAIHGQGRTEEAEDNLRDLLPLMETVKGKAHPDTFTVRRTLTQAAMEQGVSDRARDALALLPEDGGDPDPQRKA